MARITSDYGGRYGGLAQNVATKQVRRNASFILRRLSLRFRLPKARGRLSKARGAFL